MKWVALSETLSSSKHKEEVFRPILEQAQLLDDEHDKAHCPLRAKHFKGLAELWKLSQKRKKDFKRCSTAADFVKLLVTYVEEMALKEREWVSDAPEPEAERVDNKMPVIRQVFKPYEGDKFGTRGAYDQGLIYASRMPIHATFHHREDDRRSTVSAAQSVAGDDEAPGGPASDDESHPTRSFSTPHGAANSKSTGMERNFSPFHARPAPPPSDGKAGIPTASDAEVASSLLELASSPDPVTRRSCAAALKKLSLKDGFHSSMIKAGAMEALLLLHDSKDEVTRDDAVQALCNFVMRSRDASVMKPEVASMLIHGIGDMSMPTLHELCVETLTTFVSLNPDSLDNIPQDQLTPVLAAAACRHPHPIARPSLYAQLLYRAAMSAECRNVMVRDGGLQAVLALMLQPDPEAQLLCALTMQTLVSIDRAHKEKIIAVGAVAPLAELSRSSDSNTSSAAFSCLEELCREEIGRAALMTSGALSRLLRAAREEEGSMRQRVSGVLRELAVDPACRSQLIDEGAVHALVAMSGSGSSETERNCAVALCSLLIAGSQQDVSEQSSLLQMGALGALSALAHSHDTALQAKAARTLCDLSYDEQLGRKMVEAGGLDTLLALSECDNTQIRLFCAIGLHNLTAIPEHHERLMNSSAVTALLALAADREQAIQARCAAALSNLSFYKEGLGRLASAGLLKTSLQLAKHEVSKIRAAITLCNLSSYQPIRTNMVKSGAVSLLIGLSRCNLELVKQDCVRALCNLSQQPGCEQMMAEDNVTSGLIMIAMFRSDSLDTKDLCVRTLFNLMNAPTARDILLRDEAAWAFAKLAATEPTSDVMKLLCAHAMCSLSCVASSRPHVASGKVLSAIGRVSRMQHAAARRACAATVRNLSWDAPEPSKLINDGVLHALVELANNAELAVAFHVSAALCNLSANAPACELMVEKNAMAALLLLAHGNIAEVESACATCLVNMTAAGRVHLLVEQRIVAALTMLSNSKSISVMQACASALYNLTCTSPSVLGQEMAAGLMLPLINVTNALLREPKPSEGSRRAVHFAAAAICNLARVGSLRAQLAGSDVRGMCQQLVTQFPSLEVLCYVSVTTCFLSTVAESSEALVPVLLATAHALLKRMDSHPIPSGADLALRRVILRALCNLSHDATARDALASAGVVPVIIKSCQLEPQPAVSPGSDSDSKSLDSPKPIRTDAYSWQAPPEVQFAACVVLWNISRSPVSRPTLLSDGGAVAIVQLAHAFEDAELHNMCAATLCNLSWEHADALSLQPGVLSLLHSLTKSQDADTRRVCAVALRHLSGHEDDQARVLDDGGVEMLVQLMMTDQADGATPMADCSRASRMAVTLLEPSLDMLVSAFPHSRPQGSAPTVGPQPQPVISRPIVEPLTVTEGAPPAGTVPAVGGPSPNDLRSIPQYSLWPKVAGGGMAVSGLAPAEPAGSEAAGPEALRSPTATLPSLPRGTRTTVSADGLRTVNNAAVNGFFPLRLRGTWAPLDDTDEQNHRKAKTLKPRGMQKGNGSNSNSSSNNNTRDEDEMSILTATTATPANPTSLAVTPTRRSVSISPPARQVQSVVVERAKLSRSKPGSNGSQRSLRSAGSPSSLPRMSPVGRTRGRQQEARSRSPPASQSRADRHS